MATAGRHPIKQTWPESIIRDSFQPLLFAAVAWKLWSSIQHWHVLFVLRGKGKWGLCLSDPARIPGGQCVTALILCLVDTRMIAWLWTVSLPLCTLKDYRDTHSFVCSFVHLFIWTFVKNFYVPRSVLEPRDGKPNKYQIHIHEDSGSIFFLLNPMVFYLGVLWELYLLHFEL